MRNPSCTLRQGIRDLLFNQSITVQEEQDALEYLDALEQGYEDVLRADRDLNCLKDENLAF